MIDIGLRRAVRFALAQHDERAIQVWIRKLEKNREVIVEHHSVILNSRCDQRFLPIHGVDERRRGKIGGARP